MKSRDPGWYPGVPRGPGGPRDWRTQGSQRDPRDRGKAAEYVVHEERRERERESEARQDD